MVVLEVNNEITLNAFHKLPFRIYRDTPDWVPLLRMLVENSFDSSKNAALRGGAACRWIVQDEKGEPLGRIAAFFTKGYMSGYEQPTGGIGYFESVNSQPVANLLFDTAREWLTSNGLEAMDGPIHPGENFFNWGVLTDGFKQQTFGMSYHMPYYIALFEGYGFQTYYEQYSFRMDITRPDLPERFWKIAEWVAKKPDFSFEHFTFKNQDKYIADFIQIYNDAWSRHDNFKPADPKELKALIEDSKLFLEEEFIWFVYHAGKPVAFFMMIPDLNQVIKKLNGNRLGFFNLLKIYYYKRAKVINRCRVVAMGVVPKFQRSGLESGIFYQLRGVMLKKPWYREMELSWVGDFNPKMIALFKAVGSSHEITHKTMRYLFDRSRPFKRAETIKD